MMKLNVYFTMIFTITCGYCVAKYESNQKNA